jgi:RNA polymerase sigma-70 factor (ECF subfamily)
VGSEEVPDEDPVAAIYHRALPHVYGYLLSRCGDVSLAEDLAAETFMAAVDGAAKPDPPRITVPWLIGVAPQRAALTLRYLDGLPVADVAAHLGRSLHATETLLARSRAALRTVYREEGRDGR